MPIKRGLTYPLTVENGTLKLSEDDNLVAEAIYSTLETRPAERVWRPRYGLPDYAFTVINSPLLIPSRIEVALRDQVADPERFTVSGSYTEQGTLTVDVQYTLRKIAQPPIQFRLKV